MKITYLYYLQAAIKEWNEHANFRLVLMFKMPHCHYVAEFGLLTFAKAG